MKTTIRYAVVGILALLCGGAFADGVPLITPGPAIAAKDPVRDISETKRTDFVKLHPIAFNKLAFGANVLTVVVDGKEHRFVGEMRPSVLPSSAPKDYPKHETWFGTEGTARALDFAMLTLTRDAKSGLVSGTMFVNGRQYVFDSGRAVMVETNPDLAGRPQPMLESPPALPASAPKGR